MVRVLRQAQRGRGQPTLPLPAEQVIPLPLPESERPASSLRCGSAQADAPAWARCPQLLLRLRYLRARPLLPERICVLLT